MFRKIRLTIILLGGFLFLADRLFKFFSTTFWSEPHLINKFFGWFPFSNDGIAFGIPIPNWLIITLSAPLIVIVLYFTVKKAGYMRLGLLLVLIGAMSNFFDRLYFQHTLDYLLILTSIFNIADILIVGGAILCAFNLNNKDRYLTNQ